MAEFPHRQRQRSIVLQSTKVCEIESIVIPARPLTRDHKVPLTRGGAWLTFAERERGILAPGYVADLTVVESDPLTAPLDELVAQGCRMTMVGGRVVHGDGSS